MWCQKVNDENDKSGGLRCCRAAPMRVRAALARYKSELADARSQVTSSARDVEVLLPSAHLPCAIFSKGSDVYCNPPQDAKVTQVGLGRPKIQHQSRMQHCHHCMP